MTDDQEAPPSGMRVDRGPSTPLAHGRSVASQPDGAAFTVVGPEGNVELFVRITPNGPVLSFSSASLVIAQVGRVSMNVDRLTMRAREAIELETSGSFSERITGDRTTHCEGAVRVEAGAANITTHAGRLELDSTQDLTINGQQVLINCEPDDHAPA